MPTTSRLLCLYNQNFVIDKINAYLKSKNREMILPHGYCHGISLLWLYKMSERNEDWFYRLIKKIVDHQGASFDDIEMDVEKFLAHIEWLQNSAEYVSNIQQEDVDKLLDFPERVTLSYVFNQRELNDTLAEVLPKIQMTCISGPTHTIGCFHRDNKYYLFDPNYDKGEPQVFEDIKSLKTEIINCLFAKFKHGVDRLPIALNVIQTKQELKKEHFSNEEKISILNHLVTNFEKANQPSSDGITPLYVASDNGDALAAEVYLAKGVNPNLHDRRCEPALSLAAEKGYAHFVRVLLQHKANPDLRDHHGSTPLILAATHDHEETVNVLIKGGANIHLCDKWGDTALHEAVNWGHPVIVARLLKAGAEPLCQNKAKISPLHLAASSNQWALVLSLLLQIRDFSKLPTEDLKLLKAHAKEIVEALSRHNDSSQQHALQKLIYNQLQLPATRQNTSLFVLHSDLSTKGRKRKREDQDSPNNRLEYK